MMDPFCLNRWEPKSDDSIGSRIMIACLMEATAPKVGNVHPEAAFHDMDFGDFERSAHVARGVFDRAAEMSCGELILEAVRATRTAVGKNTNLGIVLLLGPLVHATPRTPSTSDGDWRLRWQSAITRVCQELTADDSRAVYEAIRIANPGGLGSSQEMDVQEKAPPKLMDAMSFAASRDLIAAEYAQGFPRSLHWALELKRRRDQGMGWLQAIVACQLEQLASEPDSLILRKFGQEQAIDVQRRANHVVKMSREDTQERSMMTRDLDTYLRQPQGDRQRPLNPGTTADLMAAAIWLAMDRSLPLQVPHANRAS